MNSPHQSDEQGPDRKSTTPNVDPSAFVSQFLPQRRALFEYILMLLSSPNDAEDVLQETSTLLWERFHEFEPGTSFLAWARRVAYFKVCEHRRARLRQVNILDDDVLEAVAATAATDETHADLRRAALSACVRKLSAPDRSLLNHRYLSRSPIKEVAEGLGRPVDSVYKSLARIRKSLLECIRRNVARAEREGASQ